MAINTLTSNGVIRELASRYLQGGGYCRLLWNSETEEISLEVKDRENDFTVRDIPNDSALDAWHHPYAYAEWTLKTGKDRFHAAA